MARSWRPVVAFALGVVWLCVGPVVPVLSFLVPCNFFSVRVGCPVFFPCFLFPAPLLQTPFIAEGVLRGTALLFPSWALWFQPVLFVPFVSPFLSPSVGRFRGLLAPPFCSWAPLCSLLDGPFVRAGPSPHSFPGLIVPLLKVRGVRACLWAPQHCFFTVSLFFS